MRLTFVDTAAEVEKGSRQWLFDDRQALVGAGFNVTDFTFTHKNQDEVKKMLDDTDFIFISGGNTFFLLQEMNKSGFSDIIKEYVDKGLLYGGSSAGSIVAGPDIEIIKDIDDPKVASDLKSYRGLGLCDVTVLPHWGNDHFKQGYEKVLRSGFKKGNKLILLTDDQYLLVQGDSYSIESI